MQEEDNPINDYLITSSPLNSLESQPFITVDEFKNHIDSKITFMKSKKKNYLPNIKSASTSFAELKANSIIYNIPQFSVPEVNYEISDKIREKIHHIKEEIVNKLPLIKSSNYPAERIDAHFSHRTVIKELQEWLREKLKKPPLKYEDSIQYKNMIMGIGMKEIIRIISTRCAEEGNMVSEIWELTWSICRQIIIYLSKRAKKCEEILDEQLNFIKTQHDKNINKLHTELTNLRSKNNTLQTTQTRLSKDITRYRKKNKEYKLQNIHFQHMNANLKEEYIKLLQENVAMVMEQGSHKQRDWMKKMYQNVNSMKGQQKNVFKQYIDRILEDNEILAGTQDMYEEFEMKGDINKLKEQQRVRNDRIAKEIEETFRKFSTSTQTEVILHKNRTTNTESPLYEDECVGTRSNPYTDTGVNPKQTKNNGKKNLQKFQQKKPQNQHKPEIQFLKMKEEKVMHNPSHQKINDQTRIEKVSQEIQTEFFEEEPFNFSDRADNYHRKNEFFGTTIRKKSTGKENEIDAIVYVHKQQKNQIIKKYEGEISKLKQLLVEKEKLIELAEEKIEHEEMKFKSFEQSIINQQRKGSFLAYGLMNNQSQIYESGGEGQIRVMVNNTEYHKNQETSEERKFSFKSDHKFKEIDDQNYYIQSKRNSFNKMASFREHHSYNPSLIHPSYRDTPQHSSVLLTDCPSQSKHIDTSFQIPNLSSLNYTQIFFNTIPVNKIIENNHNIHLMKENPQIMEEYREMVKGIMEIQQTRFNEKQMRTSIQKNIFPVLKELQAGIKRYSEKLFQLKGNYSSFGYVVANRFNRNFGVKSVASKHLKNLLVSFKFINKFTKKYTIMAYFLLEGFESELDTELFFMYILISSHIDSSFIGEKVLSIEELKLMKSLCIQYLSQNKQIYEELQNLELVYEGLLPMTNEVPNTYIECFRNVVLKYKTLSQSKAKEFGFLYEALSWIGGMTIEKFLKFISVFRKSVAWQNRVMKCFMQEMKNDPQFGGIVPFPSFIRFTLNCPEFCFEDLYDLLEEEKQYLRMEQIRSVASSRSPGTISKNRKKKIEKYCKFSQFTRTLGKFLLEKQNLQQTEFLFLENYLQFYIVQKQVEELMGPLIAGVLNAKTSELLLVVKVQEKNE